MGMLDDLDKWLDQVPSGVDKAADFLVGKIQEALSTPGNGRPSHPGEPPRKQTGRLMRSVHKQRDGQGGIDIVVGAPYGKVLDEGSTSTSLESRPFFWTTIDQHLDEVSRIILDKSK